MTRSTATLAWIQLGIVAGLTTSVVYPLLLFAPLPRVGNAFLAAVLGPAIGLWYLAVTIQAWRSLVWARNQVGSQSTLRVAS